MDYQEPPKTLAEADVQTSITRVADHSLFKVSLTERAQALKARPANASPARERDALSLENDFNVVATTYSNVPIYTRHLQREPHRFNQQHNFTSMRVDTANHGSWAVYNLSPNSVLRNSVGILKVTGSTTFRVGGITGEASMMRGFVTGYQDYPVPMTGFNLRLNLYETTTMGGHLSIGTEMSAMPYLAQQQRGGKWVLGVVGTSPYLNVKFSFDKVPPVKPRFPRI